VVLRAWRALAPLVTVGLGVAACNQITGESSLSFDGGDDGSADGGSCGSLSYSGDCQTCLQASCCNQAQACSNDSACAAFQQCNAACGTPGNKGCYAACVSDNQCGLPLSLQLSACLGTSCAAACFASPPDASACLPIEFGPCNQDSQCGCAKGQNCVVSDVAGDTSCVVAGSVNIDEACTAPADCAVGLTCYGGACLPFCSTDASCAKVGSKCYEAINYVQACSAYVGVPGEGVCSSACDPLDASSVCGAGLGCYPSGDTSYCEGPTGAGTGPGGCSASTYCSAGYECITYTASYGDGTSSELQRATCESLCRVSMTDCASSKTCTPLTGAPTVNGVAYGVCTFNCDLVTSAGCPSGTSCLVSSPQGEAAFTDCVQTGTAVGANGCTATGFDCAPGYYCSSGNCTKYCKTSSDCASGACTQFSPPFSVQGVTYGFCN
jgi:hypothetical protein